LQLTCLAVVDLSSLLHLVPWCHAQTQTADIVPADVTVASGTDAVFNCSGSSYVEWSVYSYQGLIQIFDSRPQYNATNPKPTKYQINGTYNLVVKSVAADIDDATTYQCHNGGSDLHRANLVVIDQSTLQLAVSAAVPGQLTVGGVAYVMCSVSYVAPSTDPMSSSKTLTSQQEPQLSLMLNYMNFLESTTVDTQPASNTYSRRTKTATCNHTITASDAGKNVSCTVTSLSYTQTVTMALNIPYAPNKLNITYNTTQSIGNKITCTANGYPTPTVSWIPLTGTGLSQQIGPTGQGFAVLTVGNPEVQSQQWRCLAKNSIGNTTSDISFIVGTKAGADTSAAVRATFGESLQICLLLVLLLAGIAMLRL
jgi:hypothetical protein